MKDESSGSQDGALQSGSSVDHEPLNEKQSGSFQLHVKSLLTKSNITLGTCKLIFKAALAPTIVICAYQSTAWASEFTTVGYLGGIVAVLSGVMAPRAKFLQTMLIQCLALCTGACFALLASYCAVQARINAEGSLTPGTGGPGTSGLAAQGAETAKYNSSASAVAGVWLFVEIYLIAVVRGSRPQYTIPCVIWAIFANVSLTYAPQFSTMTQAISLCKHLMTAMLTGFGVATGISLFVFPVTSREVLFNGMRAYIAGLRTAIKANQDYLDSWEHVDMFAAQRTNTAGQRPPRSREAETLRAKMRDLGAAQAKLAADLPFAKREVALGKLGPDDLKNVFQLLSNIAIPATGLNVMSDIFDHISTETGWDRNVSFAQVSMEDITTEAGKERMHTLNEWHELTRLLKAPFRSMSELIDEGLAHVTFRLRLAKRPKNAKTNHCGEAAEQRPQPGDEAFADYFDRQSDAFMENKKVLLRGWCKIHGLDLSEDFFSNPNASNFNIPEWMNEGAMTASRRRIRRQLMVMLYLEWLLFSISRRIYEVILLAEQLEQSGKLSRTRIVVPGWKQLRKWALGAILHAQVDGADEHMEGINDASIRLGQAYRHKKDPEHLPPQNTWERASNEMRKVSHFFASSASQFGLRVAVATMCLAIINYLRPTQVWFTTNRLFWAQIMVSIGMAPSAGQGLRTSVMRISGTVVAFIAALIAWYIVDEKTPGILVFYFIFLHLGGWWVLKYPAVAPVGMIYMVTLTLIIGYELQVRKVGKKVATSNGQGYEPIYLLGPIRLATVVGGLSVGWFWSVFPYPVSEHSQLRESLGASIHLLAKYYSVVHETVQLRLRGAEGDLASKGSPGRQLEKARHKAFAKTNSNLAKLRSQAGFIAYDIPIGGRFPLDQYNKMIESLQQVFSFMALISAASQNFANLRTDNAQGSKWLGHFREVFGEANVTSQSVTTVLALLSASIGSGQALPPYIRVPEAESMTVRLNELDSDLLSVRHIAEPGYASYAVIQIASQRLVEDLKDLLDAVKDLVGELDFSYDVLANTPKTDLKICIRHPTAPVVNEKQD